MKKIILIIAIAILFSPLESLAKKPTKEEFNPLSPDKIERILDNAATELENKEHIDGIKEYYDKYMDSIQKFSDRMADVFKDFF